MDGFKFDFSKFSGEGSPLPRTLPLFFSGFSLGLGFAFNSQASPSILGRFAPLIRASPSTFVWIFWVGPKNKFLGLSVKLAK